jgi:hypothetical protein
VSDKAKNLQAMLEKLGHKNVRVWWEPISNVVSAPTGWTYYSDNENLAEGEGLGIGYNFAEAAEYIRLYMKAVLSPAPKEKP